MKPLEQILLNMLSNNDVTFYIPPYQRNYEWTKDQCSIFFDDIVKTCHSNSNGEPAEHFFGTVTYFQVETTFSQPNRLILIDGQQRITTTMLFLAAMRDLSENKKTREFIDKRYLRNERSEGGSGESDSDYKIKLKQVETDWGAYRDIILCQALDTSEKNSRVYRNYILFKNWLQKYGENGEEIEPLIDNGLSKFRIITIELEPTKNPWENPQEIFESMNSLGKPLSLADLVRNYLLLGLDDQTQETYYNKYWLHIEKTLPDQVSNYIRDYMQWRMGESCKQASEANYKALYALFKNQKLYDGDAESILQDLCHHADLYACIIWGMSANNGGASTNDKVIDDILSDIRFLRVTTAYSFLLGLLVAWKENRFSQQEMEEILKAFRIYCLRRRLVAINSAENKVFPTLVEKIDRLESAEDKGAEMFLILSRQEYNLRLPNDSEIINKLKSDNFFNTQYCKFFLALLEENITKSRPNISDAKLQVEHIMPQTLSDTWREELGEDYESVHQQFVHNIGNLTLIRHNQELGQKSFAEKKDTYQNKAGIQIAKTMIVDQDNWNQDTIISRGEWMAECFAQDVLPIPDSMRGANNYVNQESHRLSFQNLQIIGETIYFHGDPSISAKVISDTELEFEGIKWKISPLTREIQSRKGNLNKSGKYQGAHYWDYNGKRLSDLF